MNFVMGSSSFLQPPFYRYPLSISSPSSSSSPPSSSALLRSFKRNAEKKRQNTSALAHLSRESRECTDFCKRRAVLFVGISVLPFLRLRARAFEERDVTIQGENQEEELSLQSRGPPNPFLSLLNSLGIFSSGVLGALYALAQKDKKATEATIESMKSKLKEKEAAIVSVGNEYEMQLLSEQEERSKQLRKAKEEQQALMNQLQSANNTIRSLGKGVQNDKQSIEELKVQIDSLQNSLTKSAEDKEELERKLKEKIDSVEASQKMITLLSSEIKDKEVSIQNLCVLLSGKDVELKNLGLDHKKTEKELAQEKSEIEKLKVELVKTQKELLSKNSALDSLNERLSSLTVERDNSSRRVNALEMEYGDLKASSEKKLALDAKLLREREHECQHLKDKLESALNEAKGRSVVIADLTREGDDLREMLDTASSNVKNLKHELQAKQYALVTSINEASDLAKQLKQSNKLRTELETQVSRIQSEISKAQESLRRSLDDSKMSGQMLASELALTTDLLKKSKEELQVSSIELAATVESHDCLQKELLDVFKKMEDVAHDLKEERKIVASLNKEMQHLGKQCLKDKEAQKSLEKDLEVATKSLDEMNRNALVLSGELKIAHSHVSNLEEERDMLHKTVADQKNFTKEARDNLEDAHNLVMRLGKERGSLEKRSKKVEEELLTAKGEILRLRSRINSSRTLVNDQQQSGEPEGNASVYAKKSGRRKSSPHQ